MELREYIGFLKYLKDIGIKIEELSLIDFMDMIRSYKRLAEN